MKLLKRNAPKPSKEHKKVQAKRAAEQRSTGSTGNPVEKLGKQQKNSPVVVAVRRRVRLLFESGERRQRQQGLTAPQFQPIRVVDPVEPSTSPPTNQTTPATRRRPINARGGGPTKNGSTNKKQKKRTTIHTHTHTPCDRLHGTPCSRNETT